MGAARGSGAGPASEQALLVLNAGSSSLKAALISPEDQILWREHWDMDGAAPSEQPQSPEAVLERRLVPRLSRGRARLSLVGHRFVHGGSRFHAPTRLDAEACAVLEALVPLAPLHHGPALRVMRWMQHWRRDLNQWACFDTAFHHTLPPAAHTYALPARWRALGLRRFGFHGLNHQHVSEVVRMQMASGADPGLPAAPLLLISCHLGAGCSLCAIRDGVSIATTMGYTPMEGLVMASRSGSLDPGVLFELLRRGISPAELERDLNAASGLLGLSGLSGSMKDLRQAAATGHPGAHLAIAVFHARLLEGIGAMAASLGGVDVIALTGGIGENDGDLKEALRRDLSWLPPHRLLVVPADEEGVIARSCRSAEQRWCRNA
ncbi:MAG: acetate/propionate family kinase [Cyanobium sp.]